MLNLVRRALVLAALGAAIGYAVRRMGQRRRGAGADAGEPEGTWGMERSGLAADPDGAR